jgi:hypothetical protein
MRFRCVALVATSVFLASGAPAQSKNAAQAQYDWGLAEMQASRYASGCPAIAESYKLDPLPGALFTLAECENKWGKLATALAHYAAYLDAFSRMTAKQKVDQVGRDQLARAQRERLDRDVPRLTVTLGASAPQDTTIRCDGDPIGVPSLGVALPLDPGDHVITAESADGRRFEEHFTLSRGEKQTRIVELKTPPGPVPPPVPPLPATTSQSPASPPAAAPIPESRGPSSTSNSSRTWLYAAGGVGVAGVTVGAVAGAFTLGDKATIDKHCGLNGVPTSCDAQGKSAADNSKVMGVVSDIGFGVGVAGLATAVVLWLVRPQSVRSSKAVTPVVASDRSGVLAGIRATW